MSDRSRASRPSGHPGPSPWWILLCIIAVALLLRVWTLHTPFYSDENPWPYAAADHSQHGFDFLITRPFDMFTWTSPPLAPLAYRFFTWPLGVTETTLRLLPLLLGLANILLVYSLARRLFGRDIGLVAAAIMAVSFWHVIASTIIEHDGSLMTFFWLLFINAYTLYDTTESKKGFKKNKWLVLAGVFLGLGLLTKYTGMLMFAALGIYLWIRERSFKRAFLKSIVPFSIGFAIIAMFWLWSFFLLPSYFWETVTQPPLGVPHLPSLDITSDLPRHGREEETKT